MTFRTCLIFLFSLSLLLKTQAQDRAPHGLAYQNPMAFSPSAYDFFHSDAHKDPCTNSKCSPFPLAAQVHETESEDAAVATTPRVSSHSLGAGMIAGPLFGILIVVFLAMGAYYVAKTRQENSGRAKGTGQDYV